MTTSYERLREECNKRLPERLELNFGCHLLYKGLGYFYLRHNDTHGHWLLRAPVTCSQTVLPSGDEWVKVLVPSFTRILGPELTITDVLRVLGIHHDTTATVRTNPACLTIRAGRGHVETYTTFDISKPISDPSNTAACEAVLKLLDSEKDRVFVCREGDDYANCL